MMRKLTDTLIRRAASMIMDLMVTSMMKRVIIIMRATIMIITITIMIIMITIINILTHQLLN